MTECSVPAVRPPLSGLSVVLVGARFPENVGMAARACANMGCRNLILVAPERWLPDKARPLATPKGEPILDRIRVVDDLDQALADQSLVVGTTARVGGWRRGAGTPEKAAAAVLSVLDEGARAALVFGREDRGLSNDELARCHRLVTIPTAGASSLNLAQAVLLMLYACLRARTDAPELSSARTEGASGGAASRLETNAPRPPDPRSRSRLATHAELAMVYATVKETLLDIDYLHPDNPDYFLMPVRRFLGKTGLRRHEVDMLMGICRQIRRNRGET
jgi:tRNA/rRNA methyltransferase